MDFYANREKAVVQPNSINLELWLDYSFFSYYQDDAVLVSFFE